MLSSGVLPYQNNNHTYKTQYILDLDSLTDLEDFVNGISNINGDINAKYGIRDVDAKSFLGMSGISQYPILVTLLSDDVSDMELFETICSKYEIKRG